MGTDDAATRDEYLNYLRPYFPGQWRYEASSGGDVDKGVITFEMSDEQRAATSVAVSDRGAADTAIHGFDPAAQCWRVVQFSADGSTVTMEVNIDRKTLTSGNYDGVTYKHRNTLTKPDGSKEVSDWTATIIDRDNFELQQVTGAAKGSKVRYTRKQ